MVEFSPEEAHEWFSRFHLFFHTDEIEMAPSIPFA